MINALDKVVQFSGEFYLILDYEKNNGCKPNIKRYSNNKGKLLYNLHNY